MQSGITHLKAQRPSRTYNVSKEEEGEYIIHVGFIQNSLLTALCDIQIADIPTLTRGPSTLGSNKRLSISLSLPHFLSLSLSLSLCVTHTHSLSLCLSLSHSLSLSISLTHPRSLSPQVPGTPVPHEDEATAEHICELLFAGTPLLARTFHLSQILLAFTTFSQWGNVRHSTTHLRAPLCWLHALPFSVFAGIPRS